MTFWLLGLALFGLLVTHPAGAHGGVQQTAEHSAVSYFQEPLSAVVNEPVTITFIIRGLDQQPLPSLDVTVSVTESTSANQADDQAVDQRRMKTDVNGALTFSKTFRQPNYYDVELTYTVPTAETPDTVGFLLQPTPLKQDWRLMGIMGTAGLVIGGFIGWLMARKNIIRISANS